MAAALILPEKELAAIDIVGQVDLVERHTGGVQEGLATHPVAQVA